MTTTYGQILSCVVALTLGTASCQVGGYLTKEECDKDGDGHLANTPECGGDDCNDADPHISPIGKETCNGRDDDCDGRIDNGTFYTPPGGSPQQVGEKCFVGVGACKVSATVQCNSPSTAICKEDSPMPNPGPSSPQFTAAPNGDWDWNCNGIKTLKCCDNLEKTKCADCKDNHATATDNEIFCQQNCAYYMPNKCRDLMPDQKLIFIKKSTSNCGGPALGCSCNNYGADCAVEHYIPSTVGCY